STPPARNACRPSRSTSSTPRAVGTPSRPASCGASRSDAAATTPPFSAAPPPAWSPRVSAPTTGTSTSARPMRWREGPLATAAPRRRAVDVLVGEPRLPGVALAVGAGDVAGRRDLQRGGAELVRDRDLKGDHPGAGRAAAEQPRGVAVHAGREREAGQQRVEA